MSTRNTTDLVDRLRSDKCMVESSVPGIYQWGIRPLSAEAANVIELLRAELLRMLDNKEDTDG